MSPKPLIAAVDCGTSAVKAAVLDDRGRALAVADRAVPCRHFPDGRVEQDARQLKAAAFRVLRQVLAAGPDYARRVAAVAVTNQRATVVCTGADGEPLAPALSWQDMRGSPELARVRRELDDRAYFHLTGLPNHPVFSLAKILCVRRRQPELYRKTARFVLLHDFLARALGCDDFYTDVSNASLTGLMDLRTQRWSRPLLELSGVPEGKLPIIVAPGQPIGRVSRTAARRSGLPEGTPIIAGGGDQQCAGLGAGVTEPGVCSITLGTASVVFCQTSRPVLDPRRRVTCCAHALPGRWCLEGLQNTAGDAVNWAARQLAGARGLTPAFWRKVAAVPPGARGVIFLPYLAGAAAPHWRAEATGMWLGLRRSHDPACLMRAVLEGVAVDNRRILDVLAGLRIPVREIRLTGGFAKYPVWNQLQADLYGRKILTLKNAQATLLGVAMLGAWGAGLVSSLEDAARRMVRTETFFLPDAARQARYEMLYRHQNRLFNVINGGAVFSLLDAGIH